MWPKLYLLDPIVFVRRMNSMNVLRLDVALEILNNVSPPSCSKNGGHLYFKRCLSTMR